MVTRQLPRFWEEVGGRPSIAPIVVIQAQLFQGWLFQYRVGKRVQVGLGGCTLKACQDAALFSKVFRALGRPPLQNYQTLKRKGPQT